MRWLVFLVAIIGPLFGWLTFARVVLAEGEFASAISALYDVDSSGVTSVTENVSFKNLTDKYYASSFTFTISSTRLYDISASDAQGPLQTELKTGSNQSQVIVHFQQQVVGKDKDYKWLFKFKSKDFADQQGKIWQISIPKAPKITPQDSFDLSLAVPVSFGDPTAITPDPVSQSEAGGKIFYRYSKEQIQNSGVLANFGGDQQLAFEVGYHLVNGSILPAIQAVPLPPDTNFQQVLIDQIEPRPENVVIDKDGNYLAYFKIDQRQQKEVVVRGHVQLHLKSVNQEPKLTEDEVKQLTASQKFWEVDSPIIKQKLTEIFQDYPGDKFNRLNNSQRAQLIDRYVVGYLKYAQSRVDSKNFERLSALTIVNNPDQALASEFTDLFVTLARAAGVPARRLEGVGISSNNQIRPLSFNQGLGHVWPEYYDADRGWLMIDPTWENTNNGVDYFRRFDLSHLVLSRLGQSADDWTLPSSFKTTIASDQLTKVMIFKLSLSSPEEVLAGFPITVTGLLENSGNVVLPPSSLRIKTTNLSLIGQETLPTPKLPPFGKFSYSVSLRDRNVLASSQAQVEATMAGQSVVKRLNIRPFYQYSVFAVGVFGLGLLMVVIYAVAFGLHLRSMRVKKSGKKGKS